MAQTPPLSNPNDNDDVIREMRAHYKTPARAKILGTIEYLEKRQLRVNKTDVFRAFNIPLRTGWRIVQDGSRTLHNSPVRVEPRGRKSKITPEQLRALDHFLQTHSFEGRRLRWLELAEQVGITGVCARTIATTLGNSYNYASCIACRVSWVSVSAAQNRWSLWNEWAAPGAVSSLAPRPIGNSFVDGWDFDIELNPNNSGQHLGELVTKLRSYFSSDPGHTYYISGAPQCPLPEVNMGAAITSAQFDYLFIQFYNNDYCSAYQLFQNDGGSFNYDSWVSYVANTPIRRLKMQSFSLVCLPLN
jgi:hypothetical protein